MTWWRGDVSNCGLVQWKFVRFALRLTLEAHKVDFFLGPFLQHGQLSTSWTSFDDGDEEEFAQFGRILCEAGLLLSSCLNAETARRVFSTKHITPLKILLSCSPLAMKDNHPLLKTSPPSIILSLLSFSLHCLSYLDFPPSHAISSFSRAPSYSVNLNYPGTRNTRFIFAHVSDGDTGIV